MTLTITLPEPLTLALQTRAAQEHKSAEQKVLDRADAQREGRPF